VPWELDPAIRRRFEKRIYIPLPDAPARSIMIRLNLGDTPNSMLPGNFDEVGGRTEGFSGSDLSVLVREALMEPLRVCQLAKQFVPALDNGKEMLTPSVKYPSCPRCPILLSSMTEPQKAQAKNPCQHCRARRMTLYDVNPDQLLVPVVSMEMFNQVLDRARKSVDPEELDHFVSWTSEFGQDG
jgi:vacuolar protein-sorting-associated protein 4